MHLALVHRNFLKMKHISHIGLGVSCLNTAKSLRTAGYRVEVWPITDAADLARRIVQAGDLTHVVSCAPWLPTIDTGAAMDLQRLVNTYPEVQFAVTCHSNVGFLGVEPNAVRLIRESIDLEQAAWNFHLAGNSERFCTFIQDAYEVPCTWLPNLYYLDTHVPVHRRPWRGGTLRVGSFGAIRPQKNTMTAGAAALALATQVDAGALEFWVSVGRNDGGGMGPVLTSLQQLYRDLPWATVVPQPWQDWPSFRRTVAHMDLLLMVSMTETFNVVSADGISQGVASVVSDAIDWAPLHWQAHIDDAFDVARVGRQLLSDHRAAHDGLKALTRHNHDGLQAWRTYLEG